MKYKEMTADEIIRLSPEKAFAVRSNGVNGDNSALVDFIRYAVWRKIKTAKQFSEKKRARLFKAFDKILFVKIVREEATNGQ